MASSPITSWQIDRETVETGTGFIFLGSKISAHGDHNHEIKRRLLLGRKAMTNLDSIKNRDITLPTKVHLVKAMVFPVVMYGCESCIIKKAEHQKTDAFELWCWRRLLRVSWTARRSNQSVLKEISSEYSWEGLMLKLKLQYLGHLMWRFNSLEKTLMLGKIEGRRRRGQQRMRWLDGTSDSMDMSLSKLQRSWWWTGMLQSMGSQRVTQSHTTEWLNWTEYSQDLFCLGFLHPQMCLYFTRHQFVQKIQTFHQFPSPAPKKSTFTWSVEILKVSMAGVGAGWAHLRKGHLKIKQLVT